MKVSNMYVYSIDNPIDFFGGMAELTDYFEKTYRTLLENREEEHVYDITKKEILKVIKCLIDSTIAVKETKFIDHNQWEGDIRGSQPYIFFLPNGDLDVSIGFVFKQDNNGDCFIACQHSLPWLQRKPDEDT